SGETMKFTLALAMNPLDQLTSLARTAEECGFSSIALPDSLFFSEETAGSYPYTPDGSRFWTADTPWTDPLVAAAAMGAVTSRIRMSPAPSEPVPIYIGGHSDAGLRRAARIGDGWTSAMITFDDLRDTIELLAKLRTEYGRDGTPFEIQAVCVDRFGLDGYRQ